MITCGSHLGFGSRFTVDSPKEKTTKLKHDFYQVVFSFYKIKFLAKKLAAAWVGTQLRHLSSTMVGKLAQYQLDQSRICRGDSQEVGQFVLLLLPPRFIRRVVDTASLLLAHVLHSAPPNISRVVDDPVPVGNGNTIIQRF